MDKYRCVVGHDVLSSFQSIQKAKAMELVDKQQQRLEKTVRRLQESQQKRQEGAVDDEEVDHIRKNLQGAILTLFYLTD